MLDFSEAQRAGFISGFVSFWLERNDNARSRVELEHAAAALMKGCLQHFRSQITRVKKIGGVVGPAQRDIFENRVKALLDAEDRPDLERLAQKLVVTFPKIKSWLDWWLRESHARMLFPSRRTMDPNLSASLPNSTNAEEAMHWKIYAALGKKFSLMKGLYALHDFAAHYQFLAVGVKSEFNLCLKM